MKTSKLLVLLLVLAMMLSIVACNTPCTEHTDADKNGVCDSCGAKVEPDPECTEHTDADRNGKCDVCEADVEVPECEEHVDANGNKKCDVCNEQIAAPCKTHYDPNMNAKCNLCLETFTYITIAEALELCGESGNVTEDRYYILANVDSVTNAQYGAMKISDDTGSISVYGTYSYDGELSFT